jgi:hypothetical protein
LQLEAALGTGSNRCPSQAVRAMASDDLSINAVARIAHATAAAHPERSGPIIFNPL